MNSIADTIRAYRESKGLSQAALGAKLGLAQSQIGSLERGEDLPTIPTLKNIAHFFQLTSEQVGDFVLNSNGRPCGARRKVPVRSRAA